MSDMQIEHTEDGECINLHSDKNISIMANNNEDITITKNRTIGVFGTHFESIKLDTTIKITDGNLDHDVVAGTATYHVKGAVKETYEDEQNTTVTSDIIIISKAKIHITAADEILLEVGASKLLMKKDGSIELSGKTIAVNGSEKVGIAGASIASVAGNDHSISGAIVVSEGKTTNTVKGGMVMLNP